tara:strand:- start:190 stop:708 length:519 start_codon:yes stop_codon:yes gene_type:complete
MGALDGGAGAHDQLLYRFAIILFLFLFESDRAQPPKQRTTSKSVMPGGHRDDDVEEVNWIFDFVMDIFKAPTWEVPIMSFIDENCIVFDGELENKFAYSELHASFRDLAESLLESHLSEVSVTPEMFVKACEIGRNQRDVNKIVWNQISAIDDFVTFKKVSDLFIFIFHSSI